MESARFSIIIAARKGAIPALSHLLKIAPLPDVEVIVARGNCPSRQRNLAAKAAKGTILYFLDDDSIIDKNNFQCLSNWFSKREVSVVGGPTLCPKNASFRQGIFEIILGSWLASGPSRARYCRAGKARMSSEKELILCNLAIRKTHFQQAGGFDEALYPNEENALLDGLRQMKREIWYDPNLLVYRSPRSTFTAFLTMLYRYGRGRGEQVRRSPTMSSALNFVPACFTLYSLLMAIASPWWNGEWTVALSPFALYFVILFLWTLRSISKKGLAQSIIAMLIFPLVHWAYGVGLWKGLMAGITCPSQDKETKVEVEPNLCLEG